jgi:hypothetical protein
MKLKLSRQWIFVLLWSALVVLLANIPYIYGYAIAPADKVFMGDARSFIDTNTYLAWIHQAADGHLLFKNVYTTEPHSRMLFHPLFALLGLISGFTGLSAITVHSLSRILFGFSLLAFCYHFISLFMEGEFNRSLAFIMVSLSGGFAWLKFFPTVNAIPEAWFLTGWVEGNTFYSIYSLPLFSASILMLLAVFYLMIRAFETGKLSFSLWAGVVSFVLISTHPYDALIIYPVIASYAVIKYFISKDASKLMGEVKSFGVMFLVSALSPLYNFWASLVNPVFREWAWSAAVTLSPGFIWYILFYGFLSALLLFGAMRIFTDINSPLFHRRLFLAVWAFAVPFLIFAPLPFQRRLIEGVHVPIAILATIGAIFLFGKLKLNVRIASAALIVLLIPGSLVLLSNDMAYLKQNSENQSVAGFLDKDIYDAMKWLEANTERDDIVLADYELGNYVPAISGNVVYIGHSPETINFWGKWSLVKNFFNADTDDKFRKEFLRVSGTKYIIYSWKERKLGGFDPFGAPYLQVVHRSPSTSVFLVKI